MTNPWLKKNPLMSIWLSAANSTAGSLRGQAGAQAKRQASAAMTQMTRDVFRIWAASLASSRQGARGRKR